jgi:flagellar export protein FliJ
MKRFVFPLQRVLEFRRQEEEAERGRLEQLAAERARLERLAEELGEESRQERATCAGVRSLPAAELQQRYEGAAALLRARGRSLEEAKQTEGKRAEQLRIVLEARRRVRLLELLRGKKRSKHGRLADRELETLAGELYLARKKIP